MIIFFKKRRGWPTDSGSYFKLQYCWCFFHPCEFIQGVFVIIRVRKLLMSKVVILVFSV